jgi:hypothetical protein
VSKVPGGEGANRARLAVLSRQHDQLLALRAEQGADDLPLERFHGKIDPLSQIEEGFE